MKDHRATEAERVASLSEKQRDSLRLTHLHNTSKAIARMRGVTPYAIDAQIDRARERLGVATRIEAAAMVMRHSPGPYEQSIYGPRAVAADSEAVPDMLLPDDPADRHEIDVAEALSAYTPPSNDLAGDVAPHVWRRPDDLSPIARALLMPTAAFLILAIVFTLLAMGDQASKWAARVLPAYQISR